MSLKEAIDLSKIPSHIAIIMDGNGRWAKARGLRRAFGHKKGVDTVREITETCVELGVQYLTLYAFSTENWQRPKKEVNAIMSLLVKSIKAELPKLKEHNIQLYAIGDLESLPPKALQNLEFAIQETQDHHKMRLTLALSYSARWEILNAVKKLTSDIKSGLSPEFISESVFRNYLTTSDMPDPELMIRTSGEYRISNFLLWQIAYTELYFSPVLWPDFNKENLYEAILDYQNRKRRFGMTDEQIEAVLSRQSNTINAINFR